MDVISIRKKDAGKIAVAFPYTPDFVGNIKSIRSHCWHLEEKSLSFTHNNVIMDKILKVFEGKKIHIDPDLKGITLTVISIVKQYTDTSVHLLAWFHGEVTFKDFS
ncbi:MAG: hypothetical protein Q7J31_07480, partial [Syntrophales bacterium]|nr:hypothetical protein [Syntrophales bacterium]